MIKINSFNEVFSKLEADYPTKRRLLSLFSIREPNFYHHPRYKAGAWDGFRKLFYGEFIHNGLIPILHKWATLHNVEILDNTGIDFVKSNDEIESQDEFIESLKLPFTPYDYQIESFNRCIHYKKMAIISTTSSGKSLVIYMLARYIQQHKRRFNKIFVIVPSKILVKQMYDDFADYSKNDESWNVEDNCTKISSDYVKDYSKDIIITTYHSMHGQSPEFYQQIEGVILDECQGIQSYADKKAKYLHDIFNQLVNSRYRFGFTGTFPDETLYQVTILKYFVNKYIASTYDELLEQKRIADFTVNMMMLHHPVHYCKFDYRDELSYLYNDKWRIEFIKKLILKNKGKNQLLLFTEIQKHAIPFYKELLKDERMRDFNIILMKKDTKKDEKDRVKELIANNNNIIVLATYKLLGTGWSVKNLFHIIFAAPLKSKQTVLQAIGRGLRLLPSQEKKCQIWDLWDRFLYNNIIYRQGLARMKSYLDENLPVKYYTIKRKDMEV